MNEIWVLGIYISDRVKKVSDVQAILTKFGCSIKTRLGLHEVKEDLCASSGLIILELTGDREEFKKLENELLKVDDLVVKKMIFIE
jgi:hypothetical protein